MVSRGHSRSMPQCVRNCATKTRRQLPGAVLAIAKSLVTLLKRRFLCFVAACDPAVLPAFVLAAARLALPSGLSDLALDPPLLAEHVLQLLPDAASRTADTLQSALVASPLALAVCTRATLHLCGRNAPPLPPPALCNAWAGSIQSALLSPSAILALAAAMPQHCRATWTRRFSSGNDGASFSAFRHVSLFIVSMF